MKTIKHSFFSAWFQQQEEFNSTIEEMTPQQLNILQQKIAYRYSGSPWSSPKKSTAE